jgi:predicted methyltransferase
MGQFLSRLRFSQRTLQLHALAAIGYSAADTNKNRVGGIMRRNFVAGLALFTVGILGVGTRAVLADEAPAYKLPDHTPGYIRKAIEDPARPADQRARDANRKPAELLMMSGIKPAQTVVEFASFGQYFTSFLSDIVGPKGTVYMYDLPYTEKRSGEASRAFVAAHPNSKYQLVDYNTLELPQQVDEVFMVLYYHDLFINKIDTASLDTRIFNALKPGGTFLIVDHNATPGSGTTDTPKLHRIDPAVIRREVTAAGFKLVEESHLLAHASDDHTQIVFSPALRGLTDQTVFVFRKPKG